ncbi:PTS sugar transporter subunit IIA [Priestia megaterium]|jgi:activator of the mannose operon, transcriptional antiterminator|uniref:BglG family transcription antiterminator n=2 Tax=Priestia megaterium TaxID=1404 RepID=UPI000BFDE051|nr:BglG family transcription antiterminator [Priestia megaterium]PGH75116.1 PTS sugar transporter subunit IIA [Priestia megaterium]PGX15982.1 PTS sugar transporter subunit IIA [Priestia megaterium]QDZ88086.1 PRD domain-containing protein [Priestia megaterium]
MNTRQKEILYLLLSEPDKYSLVQDFADRVNCSEKTIRNDLKIIEDYLDDCSDAHLTRKPGLGVYLDIEEHEKVRLCNELHTVKEEPKYQSDEERILQIAYDLLMNVQPVTAKEFADQYFLNRSTIKKDLNKIEKWLRRFSLALVSKQRIGLIIEGTEKNKRKALTRILDLINNPSITNQFIKKQFLYHEIEFIASELKVLQKRHSLYFTDDTLESLLLHTLMMIRRTKLKQSISISKREITVLQKKKEYKWTYEFLKRLEKFFVIHFSEEEVVYLTLHILGGKVRYPKNDASWDLDIINEENSVLFKIICHLIYRVSELNALDFDKDQILKNGLKIHLYTTLNRINYDLPVSNPMLNDIKKMYPHMFDIVIDVLGEINQLFDLFIPEEEAAYLTLHFQASIERLDSNRQKQKNVIIVCHMGIGMSQLLRTRIERKFHQIYVMDCISKDDLDDYLTKHQDVELVISTTSISGVKIPHLIVSPLLEYTEEKKLEDFIKQFDEPVRQEKTAFSMLDYTTPFLVSLQDHVEHRYMIIEKLAKVLYEKGYVEKEYAVHAIMREKMSATTIGAGIAIPHANSKFVKQSAVAIATLKEPLNWGTEKVTLVFMLAVKNEEQKMTKQLFQELSFISEQPSFIQKLTTETNIMKFLSYLHY